MKLGNRLADLITAFSGSWKFVGLHVIWWGYWFIFRPVEGPPWNNLTMLLSLEAILLGTFILMSQNRQGDHDRRVLEHASAEADKNDLQNQQILGDIAHNTALTLAVVRHLGLDVDALLKKDAVDVPSLSQ